MRKFFVIDKLKYKTVYKKRKQTGSVTRIVGLNPIVMKTNRTNRRI